MKTLIGGAVAAVLGVIGLAVLVPRLLATGSRCCAGDASVGRWIGALFGI